MKNWKTSLGGLFASIGAVMILMPEPQIHLWGQALTALGAALVGFAGRDANVTSASMGLDKPKE